jgi:hypothetical protein
MIGKEKVILSFRRGLDLLFKHKEILYYLIHFYSVECVNLVVLLSLKKDKIGRGGRAPVPA